MLTDWRYFDAYLHGWLKLAFIQPSCLLRTGWLFST